MVVLGRHQDDGWVAGVLVNRMPIPPQNRVALVDRSGGTREETGRGLLEAEAVQVLDRRLSTEEQRRVDTFRTFRARRARHPHKSEGMTAAVRQPGQAAPTVVPRGRSA